MAKGKQRRKWRRKTRSFRTKMLRIPEQDVVEVRRVRLQEMLGILNSELVRNINCDLEESRAAFNDFGPLLSALLLQTERQMDHTQDLIPLLKALTAQATTHKSSVCLVAPLVAAMTSQLRRLSGSQLQEAASQPLATLREKLERQVWDCDDFFPLLSAFYLQNSSQRKQHKEFSVHIKQFQNKLFKGITCMDHFNQLQKSLENEVVRQMKNVDTYQHLLSALKTLVVAQTKFADDFFSSLMSFQEDVLNDEAEDFHSILIALQKQVLLQKTHLCDFSHLMSAINTQVTQQKCHIRDSNHLLAAVQTQVTREMLSIDELGQLVASVQTLLLREKLERTNDAAHNSENVDEKPAQSCSQTMSAL